MDLDALLYAAGSELYVTLSIFCHTIEKNFSHYIVMYMY
jgi:hypothetical protein